MTVKVFSFLTEMFKDGYSTLRKKNKIQLTKLIVIENLAYIKIQFDIHITALFMFGAYNLVLENFDVFFFLKKEKAVRLLKKYYFNRLVLIIVLNKILEK